MSELQIFENPEFGTIRSVEVDGEPWLVGKDVAAALGKLIGEKGLGAVCGGGVVPAGLTMPRMQEIFACFDRY